MAIAALLPKVEKLTGEIVQVSTIENPKGNIVLITVQDESEKQATVSTGEKYWAKVGRFFKEGSIIAAQIEERIAGKTTYEDEIGEVKHHTSSGVNLVQISAFSTSAWNRRLTDLSMEKAEAAVMACDPEKASAMSAIHSARIASGR